MFTMTKTIKTRLGAAVPILLAVVVLAVVFLASPTDAQNAKPAWQIAGVDQPSVSTVNVAGGGSYTSGTLTIAAGAGGVSSLATSGGVTVSSPTGAVTLGIGNASITNAMLANPATVVNAQTCTLGSACTTPWEFNFSYKNSNVVHSAGQVHQQTTVTNAVTLQSANIVVEESGSNAGNWVTNLCDDGATCGAGHVYATCTTACTTTSGTVVACTINKAAVAAATTMSWTVTTVCNVTDPGVNANAHFTFP